jgi:tetratricopeptide (TPR) repeat protein
MGLIEKTADELRGAKQKECLERLELEDINFRFAVESSLELPGQAIKGLRLLTAAERFIEVRGLFKDARDHFAKLLAHPETANRDSVRAQALAAAGRLSWIADDMPAMAAFHTEALEIYRELKDQTGVALALADLGFHAMDAGDIPRARAWLDEASELATTLHEPRLTAHIQHVRAGLVAGDGDFEKAFDLEDESLGIYRKLGDTWQCIISSWAIGVNATALQRFDIARRHLAECLQVGLDLGNRWGTSYPLDAFAYLAVAEGKFGRAARLFGASEAQRTRSGLVPQAADHPALRAVLAAAPDFHGPAIDAARHEGRTLSLESAVALALAPD